MRSALAGLVLLVACGGGGRARHEIDAAVMPGDAAMLPALGPVVPGPALDGVDRTRDRACAESMRWVVGVVARVLDEQGAARPGMVGQVCLAVADGRRVCLTPERTGDDGVYTIVVAPTLRCVSEVALRVVDPTHGAATTYAFTPDAPVDGVIVAADVVLVALAPAGALPIGDPSATRTVALDEGATITLAPSQLAEGRYEPLASRLLRGDDPRARSVGDGTRFDTLLAIGPEGPLEGECVLGIPTSLAPGAQAEVAVLGGLYAPLRGVESVEGRWQTLAHATVDADGTVQTPAGACPAALGWIGVR